MTARELHVTALGDPARHFRVFLFDVTGTPAPQGSKRHVGNGRLIESSKRVKPWREAVAAAALRDAHRLGAGWQPLDGPLAMTVVFRLRAPMRMPKGRTWPTTYPDLSKLVRSTEDALVTAGLIRDDSRIVTTRSTKRYCEPGEQPGAFITIEEMP